MPVIQFFTEEYNYSLPDEVHVRNWIKKVVNNEGGKPIQSLNYVFCSDRYLHKMNLDYLNHDYFTDIITFDHSESDDRIEADIFISIDRIKENALINKTEFEEELYRVMIHGILHLLGYSDKTETERKIMRKKENECLTLLE